MIDSIFLSSRSADDYSVAQLYRRIISPSVKVQNEEWQKQTHFRHRNNFKGQSPVSRLKAASPAHSVASAPGQLEANDMALQVHNIGYMYDIN